MLNIVVSLTCTAYLLGSLYIIATYSFNVKYAKSRCCPKLALNEVHIIYP